MLEGQTQPLEIAKRVLTQETLVEVGQAPFRLRAWKILDRWALNSPRKLKELEAQGALTLKKRLLDQQEVEASAIEQNSEMLDNGMAEHEVLIAAQVETELL